MAKKKVILADTTRYIESSMETVLHTSMLPYAEHVILERALPRVEDGLKPVQRRILYAMNELGLTAEKPHRKSALIVGECLGKYHPHGDSSVYDAMVNMAQNFSMRETLVDGHGNFGTMDGDSAAAMRYTEARLAPIATEMLRDMDKDTVKMNLNYDDSREEPEILPSRYPNLLVNGCSGIAVGLSTNIPPHNLAESIDAIIAYIENNDITTKELMEYIPAPDFPTGGYIEKNEELLNVYESGKGKITMRAKAVIESDGDKENIVITEVPYKVNRISIIQRIYDLKESKKELFSGINEVIDEADKDGVRMSVRLKKDADSKTILMALFKNTDLRCNFNANMVAIAGGKPEQLSLKQMIKYYCEYQREIIYNRSRYDYRKFKKREHVLKGIAIAVRNIREVVDIVLASDSDEDARYKLRIKYDLSEEQAQAVIDIQLKRLTRLDIGKLTNEIADLEGKIKGLGVILGSMKKQYEIVKKELLEIKKKYQSERKTELVEPLDKQIEQTDFSIASEIKGYLHLGYNGMLKFITQRGYQQAMKSVANCSANEMSKRVLNVSSKVNVVAFTDKGNAVVFNIDALPESRWKSAGNTLHNYAKLDSDEKIIDIINSSDLINNNLFIYTKYIVKKINANEIPMDKKSTSLVISMDANDSVIGVEIDRPKDNEYLLFVTKYGKVLNAYNDVPVYGRRAGGVKSCIFEDKDHLAFACIHSGKGNIVLVGEKGLVRKVDVASFEARLRVRKGSRLFDFNKFGEPLYINLVQEDEDLALLAVDGRLLEMNTKDFVDNKNPLKKLKIQELIGGALLSNAFKHNII